MLDEALDLVEEARADGVDVRLVGGLDRRRFLTAGRPRIGYGHSRRQAAGVSGPSAGGSSSPFGTPIA